MRSIIDINCENAMCNGAMNCAYLFNELIVNIVPLGTQKNEFRIEITPASGAVYRTDLLELKGGIISYSVPISSWNGNGVMKLRLLGKEANSTYTTFQCMNFVQENDICCKYHDGMFMFHLCSKVNPTIDLIYPVGHIITNCKVDFNPNTLYEGTVWERIKGHVVAGIDEDDTDTNVRTSFNQKSGTSIGHKNLHSHGHNWVGVNDGTTVKYKKGVYPFRIYQDNAYNWAGSPEMIRKAGVGDAQNIQPTYLAYIWKRIG